MIREPLTPAAVLAGRLALVTAPGSPAMLSGMHNMSVQAEDHIAFAIHGILFLKSGLCTKGNPPFAVFRQPPWQNGPGFEVALTPRGLIICTPL
jgi:hypothetical protein